MPKLVTSRKRSANAVHGSVGQEVVYGFGADGYRDPDDPGNLNAASGPSTASFTGDVVVAGALAGASQLSTASFNGGPIIVGSLAGLAGSSAASFSGDVTIQGDLAASAQQASSSFSGSIGDAGNLVMVSQSATGSFSGDVIVTGSVIAQAQSASTAFTGDVIDVGTLAGSAQDATASFTGSTSGSGITGTLAGAAQSSSASFSGDVIVTGTLAGASQNASASFTGSFISVGTLDGSASASTGSFTGGPVVSGDLLLTAQNSAASFSGTAKHTGDLDGVSGNSSASLSGGPIVGGTLAGAAQSATGLFSGDPILVGDLAGAAQASTGSFSGSVASASNYFLTDHTWFDHAYSLRQLSSSATNCIRVRRASDSSEQDIGFSSDELDTSSLGTFCSGTTCYVTTWYDQEGTEDLKQSAAANQPTIYESGSVTTDEEGNNAMRFDNSDLLDSDNTINCAQSTTNYVTIICVMSLKVSSIAESNQLQGGYVFRTRYRWTNNQDIQLRTMNNTTDITLNDGTDFTIPGAWALGYRQRNGDSQADIEGNTSTGTGGTNDRSQNRILEIENDSGTAADVYYVSEFITRGSSSNTLTEYNDAYDDVVAAWTLT